MHSERVDMRKCYRRLCILSRSNEGQMLYMIRVFMTSGSDLYSARCSLEV